MPEYPSLAALRQGLTTDNADERGRAYGSVLNAAGDVQPSDVLSSDPSDETVQDLVDGGVIPPGRGEGRDDRPVSETRQRQTELLEQILDELRDDDVTVQDGDTA